MKGIIRKEKKEKEKIKTTKIRRTTIPKQEVVYCYVENRPPEKPTTITVLVKDGSLPPGTCRVLVEQPAPKTLTGYVMVTCHKRGAD